MAPDTFTIDVADALGGPDWLRRRRVAAAEVATSMSLPTAEAEVWRYSRIGDLDLARYTPIDATEVVVGDDPTDGSLPTSVRDLIAELGPVSGVVVVQDGRVVVRHLDEAAAAQGVVLGVAGDGPEGVLGAAPLGR